MESEKKPAERYERSEKNTVINNSINVLDVPVSEFLTTIGCKEEDIKALTTEDQVLNHIIKLCKAKRFVGAGVGGLLVNRETKEVLLYLRPKEPEKYKWSMPGGSIEFGDDATKALINEYKYITGIVLKAGDLLPLRITNHKDDNKPCGYHYLSPAFKVKNYDRFLDEINLKIKKEFERSKDDLMIKKIATDIMHEASEDQIDEFVADIKSGNYFLKEWEKSMKDKFPDRDYTKYIVKWFKIDEIKDSDKLSDPTKRALKSYLQRTKTIEEVVQDTSEILHKAAEDTCKKIKGINIEAIIETDD